MSVLNLPLEQKRAIAKQMGMSYDAWVEKMKSSLKKITEYQPTASKGNRSPQSIARAAQIQARMDNETPSG
jgi:hypothetical protein